MPVIREETQEAKTVKADARGRVTLGPIATKKNYRVSIGAQGEITLTPVIEIPEREAWLWNNPQSLAAVRRGLEDAAAGRVVDAGSFAQYANLEIDEA